MIKDKQENERMTMEDMYHVIKVFSNLEKGQNLYYGEELVDYIKTLKHDINFAMISAHGTRYYKSYISCDVSKFHVITEPSKKKVFNMLKKKYLSEEHIEIMRFVTGEG